MKDEVIVLSRNESFTYEYQGSRFRLEPRGWYPRENEYMRSHALSQKAENCILPDTYNGKPITRWICRRRETPLAAVKVSFCSGEHLRILPFQQGFFRNLERMRWRQTVRNFNRWADAFLGGWKKSCCTVLAGRQSGEGGGANTVRKIAKGAFRLLRVQIFHLKSP